MTELLAGIYVLHFRKKNKVYVGSGNNLSLRRRQHSTLLELGEGVFHVVRNIPHGHWFYKYHPHGQKRLLERMEVVFAKRLKRHGFEVVSCHRYVKPKQGRLIRV